MAEVVKYLDYAGLQRYDGLIKALIKSGDEELLEKINALADIVEGSDGESVDARIAEVKAGLEAAIAALEAKHDTEEAATLADAKAYADELVAGVIDGAPEALDTLKEIASWISSDESGTADLISKVAANTTAIADNKADIEAAEAAFVECDERLDDHDDRLAIVEALVGAAGSSESESLADRIGALEDLSHEAPEAIADDDIDALFV